MYARVRAREEERWAAVALTSSSFGTVIRRRVPITISVSVFTRACARAKKNGDRNGYRHPPADNCSEGRARQYHRRPPFFFARAHARVHADDRGAPPAAARDARDSRTGPRSPASLLRARARARKVGGDLGFRRLRR